MVASRQKTVVDGPRFFCGMFDRRTWLQAHTDSTDSQDGTGVPSCCVENSVFPEMPSYTTKSTTNAGVFHWQPDTVLLAAGNTLLNEEHAFCTIVNVRIDRVLFLE